VSVPLVVLCAVFLLIMIRQIGTVRLQIWQIMLGGALAVIVAGSIPPGDALRAIDLDVMVFLFGMFVVGQALEESGYLAHVSYRVFRKARTRNALVLVIVFGAGLASAILMNDTLAIIGTPVVLLLARKHGMRPAILLLSLAFAVTIGSVMSPIGNPQNLLIAVHGGVPQPFVTFLRWLFLPTVINLFITVMVMRKLYPDDFHMAELAHSQEPIRNHDLAVLSRISLFSVLLLIGIKIVAGLVGKGDVLPLPHIALGAALPVLVGSPKRWGILRRIDWQTLVFFASMFVVMESVWRTGFFQWALVEMQVNVLSTGMILGVSVLLSQLISNVPLVALYQPLMLHAGAGVPELMALAAGSTIAGNLFILGAASNVIIIQNAEKRTGDTLTFLEFARAGVPLTVLNVLVYWAFLRFL
jgi:Na+/H+ antiporter NhaD/arsenite permease-like protein